MSLTFKHLYLYSTLLACSPTWLWGAGQNTFMGSDSSCPANSYSTLSFTPPPVFSDDLLETTDVSAEQVENTGKSVSTFSGHVLIERHQLRLQADQVVHDKKTEKLKLSGNIRADTQSMSIKANTGWMNLKTNESEFIDSNYYIPEITLSGKSPLLSLSQNNTSILIDSQFSTCPPNKLDWHLDTNWLELDQRNATGTAKHTIFWVGGVPIFYFPWIQFPLGDERRSGILIPNVASTSTNGFEFSLPFYWNIAPNQDAIITPTFISKRGTMLSTDYRYLNESSKANFKLDYLNKDKERDIERYSLHFNSLSKLSDNLNLTLLANDISDVEYLKDFSNNLNIANTTHLEKNAKLRYANGPWVAGIMAQSYETIDDTIAINNRPYERLPQITLTAKDQLLEMDNRYLLGSLNTEWVAFNHQSINKEQGSRFNIYPKLSLPIEGNAWFVKPSAGYTFTQYDTTDTNGNDANLDARGLPILSLDSGLFFERSFTNGTFLQTLEPRLFYLNVPFEDQSSLPVFDTSAQDFNFSSLFRENRFNGADRIGDANQLTVALSSRILNKNNGHEVFNISIGQIYYFDDQRVSLDNRINTNKNSDIITEIGGNLNRWQARATLQWNTQTDASDKRSMQLSYAASEDAVFNIGYRFFRDPIDETENLEQTDLSFAWPFATNYALLSRWNYDLTNERDIEILSGIEYESCCWALRLLYQRYRRNNNALDDPYKTSIMLQFVLKGFGSITEKGATKTLKQAILGYQPDY